MSLRTADTFVFKPMSVCINRRVQGLALTSSKCIVCPQSTFFKNACEKGRWKVGSIAASGQSVHVSQVSQEGESGTIELKAFSDKCPDVADDDPRAVKLMIDYLYLRDYDPATTRQIETIVTKKEEVASARSDPAAAPVPTEAYIYENNGKSWLPLPMPDAPPGPSEYVDEWGALTSSRPCKKCKSKAAPPNPEPEPALGTGDPKLSFLEIHAKIFVIASKYDIKSLESTAFAKLKRDTKLNWWAPDLVAAIPIVFGHTSENETELRNVLKNLIVRQSRNLAEVPGFKEAIENVEGLAYDLFYHQALFKR
jgi:hypothetical protein